MAASFTALDCAALCLALAHFAAPIVYYFYLKTAWLNKPWSVKRDAGFNPKVAVVIPTYMSAKYIALRLDNIHGQNYPADRVEVLVVDSSSPDRTASIVEKWVEQHPGAAVRLIVEPDRRGKLEAVLRGLSHVSPDAEIVVLTDDDCTWDPDALRRVAAYFADPMVGAVTGSIKYSGDTGSSNTYRDFYNSVRIAESRWWSTPVHNGPLLALRKGIVDAIGLPTFPGADDSAFASYIAFAGYRAIQVDDAWAYEPVAGNQHRRMIRRATHLVTYFTKVKRYARLRGVYKKTEFDKIWRIELYLHVVNPLILALAVALLVASAVSGSLPALALLATGVALLAVKPYRTWVANQLYLLAAILRSARTADIVWER